MKGKLLLSPLFYFVNCVNEIVNSDKHSWLSIALNIALLSRRLYMYTNRRALLRWSLCPDRQGDSGQDKWGSGNLRGPEELFFFTWMRTSREFISLKTRSHY